MDFPANPPTQDHEYATVIRINKSHPFPPTHTLIPATDPAHTRHFARTATLARGHVLYDVWDGTPWQTQHAGYLVPSPIAAEAHRLATTHPKQDWAALDPGLAERYAEAWDTVTGAWPGMPVWGARRVVEVLVGLELGCGREVVEQAVVRFARRCWTGYWARLEGRGKEGVLPWVEREVCEEVREKLREVLRGWMREDVKEKDVRGVFGRCGLLDEGEVGDAIVKQTHRFC